MIKTCPDCGKVYEKPDLRWAHDVCRCPACREIKRKEQVIKRRAQRNNVKNEHLRKITDPLEQKIKEINQILEPYYSRMQIKKEINCF
jgi:hypothetical protein